MDTKPDYKKMDVESLRSLSLGHLMMLRKKALSTNYACECCGEIIGEEAIAASEAHGAYQGRLRQALEGKGHYVSKGERKVIRREKAYKGRQKKQMKY